MRKWKPIVAPMAAGILFLVLWELKFFHFIFRLEIYQLPVPSKIIETLLDNIDVLSVYSLYTLTEAVIGILLGSFIGFVIAVVATIFPKWGYGGLIVITALNAIPIIALSPIMNIWFGDGIGARAAVVTITTMAAMAVNAYKGLNDLPPFSKDLMRSFAARQITIFKTLRLPNSLPYVFTALKINATVGMIGAIVSEFFYSSKGLGYMLSNSIKIAKMPMGWACILLSAFLGILLYFAIVLLEKSLIKWHASQRI